MNEILKLGPLKLRSDLSPGEGVPLLLLNAWRAPIETLDELVQCIGNRPVLRLDMPGTGGSPASSGITRPAQLADMAADVASHHGIRQFDVAGYGFGGVIAQEMARRHARRVRRLILMGTSAGHLMFPPSPRSYAGFLTTGFFKRLRSPTRFFEPQFLKSATPQFFGGEAHAQPRRALQRLSETTTGLNTVTLMREAAGLAGWSSLAWLKALEQPTLILAGRSDLLVHPLNAILLRRLLPDAKLCWMPGGHLFPILDCPADTAAVINRFAGHHGNVVNMSAWRDQTAATH